MANHNPTTAVANSSPADTNQVATKDAGADTESASSNFEIKAPENIGDIAASLNSTLLDVWQSFVEHIPYLISGFIVLLITWGLSYAARRAVGKTLARSGVRSSLRELVQRLVGIGIWFAGLLLAAMFWFPGLTPASALGGLGLLSVAIGFAFQDIFENFFAGILLLWKFPFESGDFIECEGIMGQVENVTVRMTELRLTTGELILVPNSLLFKNPVSVLTNKGYRRISIIVGVAYDTNIDFAVESIENALSCCESVSEHHPVEVFPQEFGGSSINIEVAWWTDAKPIDLRSSRAEVISLIKRTFDELEIEIPFPNRTLSFKQPLIVENCPGE